MVSEARAVVSVFNEGQLRTGHTAELSCDQRERLRRRQGWVHANAWTSCGVQQEAFSALNKTSTVHARNSHRELDAQALVSMAHMSAVRKYYAEEWRRIDAGDSEVGWLRIHKACDEMPMNLAFGKLTDLLQPIARYWVAESAGVAAKDLKKRLLTAEEYKTHKLGWKKSRNGVLEVMAQTCSVAIATQISHPQTGAPFMQVDQTAFPLPPRIVAATDSSTLFDAVDNVMPELSFERILTLARKVRAVLISHGGDMAPANQRMWFFIADKARIANTAVVDATPQGSAPRGLILMVALGCFGHVLHTTTEAEFNTLQLIPKLTRNRIHLQDPRNIQLHLGKHGALGDDGD